MIFDELIIENFGIYNGKHLIDLSVSDEKPIILLGGLNGSGKTTFLDALQLVLYGKHAKCSNRGTGSYSKFLASTKNLASDVKDIVRLTLSFSHQTNTVSNKFRIIRSWDVHPSRETKDKIEVYCDGEIDKHLSQNWNEFVNEFIPLSLSDLFFFDGEKIENLANPDKSAELIKTGIQNLLGLDLINQLRIDLSNISKDRKIKNIDSETIVKVEECENYIAKNSQEVAELKGVIANYENSLVNLKIKLNKAKEIGRKSGTHLIEERDNIIYELGAIENKINQNISEQVKLAAGSGPLGLVSSLINETKQQIKLESKIKEAQILNVSISNYEKNILDTLTQNKINDKTIKTIKKSMKIMAKDRVNLSQQDCFLNSDLSIFNGLEERIHSENLQLKRNKSEKLQLQESKSLLEKKLVTIPDLDSVQELINNISTLEESINETQDSLNIATEKVNDLLTKKELLNTKYTNLLLKQNKDTFEEKRSIQVTDHIKKLRLSLQKFGDDLINENITNLETLIRDKFTLINRKDSLINLVKISLKSFEITLYDSLNNPLSPFKLSAGERQLLAIAILWGLAEASGKEIPTVIDTPLGRLDSKHRQQLINNYFPNASQQVILLSTDEEITPKYYKKLKPTICREYQINYNEQIQSSGFIEGYL